MAREKLPSFCQWTIAGRAVVFVLAAASIWCLLAEFYHLCSMRTFTFFALIPATLVLITMAIVNRQYGDRQMWKAVLIGGTGGFLAACAYDAFRIPFVVAAIDHIGPQWLRLPLFKVFPRFGAMILNQPIDNSLSDSQFPLLTHVVGWAYHFSNGMTFGIMLMALIGRIGRHVMAGAIALAVGLELAMLFTPYTGYFGIGLTTKFVVATLVAHLIFGSTLGAYLRKRAGDFQRHRPGEIRRGAARRFVGVGLWPR